MGASHLRKPYHIQVASTEEPEEGNHDPDPEPDNVDKTPGKWRCSFYKQQTAFIQILNPVNGSLFVPVDADI